MSRRGTVFHGLSALVIEDAGDGTDHEGADQEWPVAPVGCGRVAVRYGATAGAELVLTCA